MTARREITLKWTERRLVSEWLEEIKPTQANAGLYAIYGPHRLYGKDVLLYIGETSDFRSRLKKHHASWLHWCDSRDVRIAFAEHSGPDRKDIEELLIAAHLPACNGSSLNALMRPDKFKDLHVLNLGYALDLLPELSGAYWCNADECARHLCMDNE